MKLNQLLETLLDFPLSFFTNSMGAITLEGGDSGGEGNGDSGPGCIGDLLSLKPDFSGGRWRLSVSMAS